MYQTGTEWKENIYENIEHITNVYIDDELINSDCILELRKGGNIFDEELILGSTPSQFIEIKLYKDEDFKIPKNIKIEHGIMLQNSNLIIPIGMYNVDSYTDNDDDTITIKALDNMIKFESNYDGSFLIAQKGYAEIIEVLQDICSKAGVELRFYFFFKYA